MLKQQRIVHLNYQFRLGSGEQMAGIKGIAALIVLFAGSFIYGFFYKFHYYFSSRTFSTSAILPFARSSEIKTQPHLGHLSTL